MKHFLAALIHILKDIHMTEQDILAAVAAADAKVTKIQGETRALIGKVADLTAALANAGTPLSPAVDAALAALNDHLQATDDLVADAPAPDASGNPPALSAT
jgi:hypothetical protein